MNSMPFEEHLKNDINVTKPQIVINSQTIYMWFSYMVVQVCLKWLMLIGYHWAVVIILRLLLVEVFAVGGYLSNLHPKGGI